MVIYQLHIGTYAIQKPDVASNFLDIVGKIPYLESVGCNVLQPLPIDEQEAHPGRATKEPICFHPNSLTSAATTHNSRPT